MSSKARAGSRSRSRSRSKSRSRSASRKRAAAAAYAANPVGFLFAQAAKKKSKSRSRSRSSKKKGRKSTGKRRTGRSISASIRAGRSRTAGRRHTKSGLGGQRSVKQKSGLFRGVVRIRTNADKAPKASHRRSLATAAIIIANLLPHKSIRSVVQLVQRAYQSGGLTGNTGVRQTIIDMVDVAAKTNKYKLWLGHPGKGRRLTPTRRRALLKVFFGFLARHPQKTVKEIFDYVNAIVEEGLAKKQPFMGSILKTVKRGFALRSSRLKGQRKARVGVVRAALRGVKASKLPLLAESVDRLQIVFTELPLIQRLVESRAKADREVGKRLLLLTNRFAEHVHGKSKYSQSRAEWKGAVLFLKERWQQVNRVLGGLKCGRPSSGGGSRIVPSNASELALIRAQLARVASS